MLWLWGWGANFEPLSKRVRVTYNAVAASLLIIGLCFASSEHPEWSSLFVVASVAASYFKLIHAAQRRKVGRVKVTR